MGCLYKLTSPSGKSYIGISHNSMEMRWAKHVEHALGKRDAGALYNALRKYGPGQFNLQLLAEESDWDKLCDMEKAAIREQNTLTPNGYNITTGGEGTFGPVISEAHRRQHADPIFKAKHKEAMRRCADHISKTTKRSWNDPEKRARMNEKWTNPEMREMMLRSLRAAGRRPEVKQHRSAAAKALWSNPEFRRKNIAGQRKRHEIKKTA